MRNRLMTPMVAVAILLGHFVEWVEKHTSNRIARAVLRMLFNPSRTLANLAESRAPWRRPDRSIGWK